MVEAASCQTKERMGLTISLRGSNSGLVIRYNCSGHLAHISLIKFSMRYDNWNGENNVTDLQIDEQ